MKKTLAQAARSLENFRLPRYHEIPNVGLYLEQTCQYINEYLELALPGNMTVSMISNYVKKGLIENPVKKQYRREQIAYLFFIAVAKNVLSLDALQYFIQLQQRTYPMERAYNYFVEEFENQLQYCFELKANLDTVGVDALSNEKRLLYSCVASVTQKIYLEKCLEIIAKE
jgi:DNA-binding transcriptional MerR regulator